MSKFPLLEQMRAQRDRHEAEITAPYRAAIDQYQAQTRRLQAALREIEKMVGSEIGKYAIEEMAHMLSAELRRAVMEALAKAGHKPGAPVELLLPADTLRFMDAKSMERAVLDRYVGEAMPSLRLRTDVRPNDMVTVLDIRIPEFGMRRAVAN